MEDEERTDDLIRHLRRANIASAGELARVLGVSQPTVSRLIRRAGDRVVRLGRGRSTRYAARREVPGVPPGVTVWAVGHDDDASRPVGVLHAVGRHGYAVAWPDDTYEVYPDLPWFLLDLRPAGFVGRLIARRLPAGTWPASIERWSGDDILRYLVQYGWDAPGQLVVGDVALAEWRRRAMEPAAVILAGERAHRYAEYADDVLAWGDAGSSAAGEQPKFLATLQNGDALRHVLVKFSPPFNEPVGRCIADLLVAEHLAGVVLADAGVPAATTRVLDAGGRRFLEVERFDRVGAVGRRGVVSLLMLDAHFVGTGLSSWWETCEALVDGGLLDAASSQRAHLLWRFGELIGNTDMHHGNLSVFVDGVDPRELAPSYDMLPMMLAPRQGHLPRLTFRPLPPRRWDPAIEARASALAQAFWQRLAGDERVSAELRALALDAVEALRELAEVVR